MQDDNSAGEQGRKGAEEHYKIAGFVRDTGHRKKAFHPYSPAPPLPCLK
jgi:hypothetical protein